MKLKVVKFALDLGVMKTKIASLSKGGGGGPFLLVLRVRFGSGNMTSNDLLCAQADIEKRLIPFFSAKRPYNK